MKGVRDGGVASEPGRQNSPSKKEAKGVDGFAGKPFRSLEEADGGGAAGKNSMLGGKSEERSRKRGAGLKPTRTGLKRGQKGGTLPGRACVG